MLKIKHADISPESITFIQDKPAKFKMSITPAPEENIMAARRPHGQTTPSYLMGQRNGKIRKCQGVQDLLQRNVDKNRLDDIHLHDFRANAITDTKMQGHDPQALADDVTEAKEIASLRPEV